MIRELINTCLKGDEERFKTTKIFFQHGSMIKASLR